MPELPDLHVFSKNLKKRLAGRRVSKIAVEDYGRKKFSEKEINDALAGSRVTDIRQEGKELHFFFDNGKSLGVHLMLQGELHLTENPDSVKYKIITIAFDKGPTLIVSDPRGWATVTLNPKPSEAPDALAPECDLDYVREKLQRHKTMPVKTFLLEQKILRGIGNAYADEILYASRIAPESKCGKIPEDAVKELHSAIRSTLKNAIKEIEKRDPDIISGEIRDFLQVHQPRKKQTPSGHAIKSKMVGQKKTYFTDEQVLYEENSD